MVVQHNLTAMNSNRMLGVTTGSQAKSTEKLSSGYKINRAADDAAGLSISEKMRKQIRGLTQASLNAEDGISAVQTAEGALNEVQDMLQRMNELAVKASNGSMSENDRSYIQDEVDALLTEIDRVAETTKFNETYLLKGNAEGTSSEVTVNAHDAGLAGKLVDNGDGTYSFTADKLGADGTIADGTKVTIAGKEYTIDAAASGSGTSLAEVKKAIDAAADTGATVKVTPAGGGAATTYTYAAATTYAETDLETAVGNAITAGAAGDKITIDGTEYTYKEAVVGPGQPSAITTALGGTPAVGDKITVTISGATKEYTYAAAKYAAASNATVDALLTSASITPTPAGDTLTINGTEYHYDADTGNGGTNAGWYAEGKTAATDSGDKKALTGLALTSGDVVVYNKAGGASTTMEIAAAAKAAGWYTAGGAEQLSAAPTLAEGDSYAIDTVGSDTDGATVTIGAAASDAGFYNGSTKLAAGDVATKVTGASTVKIEDADTAANNIDAKVGGEKTAAGFYNATTKLPDDIAAGSEVEITPAGGDAQTFTVADLSSGKINTAGALDLMKAELEAASSIGAAKQAATAAVETDGTITITQGKVDVKDGLSFGLHVGADADMTNKIRVDIDSMSAAGLGVVGLNVKDTTGMSATYAIDAIQDAIQKVSTQRSALGAVQNRLEHTIANLDNVVENTTAAESQIRDTDMASEMVKYSNNNILAQAGTSMLAQANQANQNILSLLG